MESPGRRHRRYGEQGGQESHHQVVFIPHAGQTQGGEKTCRQKKREKRLGPGCQKRSRAEHDTPHDEDEKSLVQWSGWRIQHNGYWRTPEVLRRPEGRAAVGVGADEHVLGLLHLGHPRQEKGPPDRLPPGEFVTYLS